ncbi:Hypothetical predicted protein [Lecanosticta acicola]|uniref:Cell wall protein PhiA n=1 Tax=Lecanosticta acicola TaxID=111012 RepID=A0AAI8YRQ0_9PEZI|nr:Hypothetical predicted protein [Lecanosticta acicola]
MQIKNLALFAATAAALPAASTDELIHNNDAFNLIAIKSGSGVQNSGIKASGGYFYIGAASQNASCDSTDASNTATFYLSNDNAYLYTASARAPQQLWVDRSGMGKGIWGYTTGAQAAGRNSERTPWTINAQSQLLFDGASPAACPQKTPAGVVLPGEWSVWWDKASDNPGNNYGDCIDITLKAVKVDKPVGCHYTEAS